MNKALILEITEKYNLAPNKKLGQNFLINNQIINRIVDVCLPDGEDILEIGPGLGSISRGLAERGKSYTAVEIDSGFFLKEQEDKLNDRIQAFTKRTDNYAYTTLTPGAENKHLKAFRVTIDAKQDHKGVGYQHEGEEFVYVISGRIEVVVGEHINTLDEGESLQFNSAIRHKLKNIGEEEAKLLVVIYGP